nr:hypothetical protein [Tanacetum cinerariifolium]
FLGAAAGTEEEQEKNFQWGLHRQSGGDNHRSSNNNYSGNKNMLNFKSIQSSSTHKHDPNITCGQAGHLQKDCKKNTTASTFGQADKKPGALGRVFAITEDHATKTSG